MSEHPTSSVAVVTGAARGIGRAIAERLVVEGYKVVITDVDQTAAERTAEEIGAVEAVGQDVREESEHTHVAERATAHGRLTLWVNNAGVGHDGSLSDLSSDEVRRLIDINLYGVVWGMRAAMAAFSGGGDIINISSLSALGPVPGLSIYAATKAATLSLTMSVASEVSRGVRVHALCPDGVSTQLVSDMQEGGQAKALLASGGRLLAPAEVAEAVMSMIGSRRIVRTVPSWRGGMMRVTALAPAVLMKLEPLTRQQGSRALKSSR